MFVGVLVSYTCCYNPESPLCICVCISGVKQTMIKCSEQISMALCPEEQEEKI